MVTSVKGEPRMTCYNNFCIYEKENNCILDTITLNETGMCLECININIPEEIINREKMILLEKYDKTPM